MQEDVSESEVGDTVVEEGEVKVKKTSKCVALWWLHE